MRFLILAPIIIAALVAAFIVTRAWLERASRRAQERRESDIMARAVRIIGLEHEVGLHAEIDARCILCERDERARLDRKWLGKEAFDLPYTPLTDMARLAYDKDMAFRTRRGTASGGPR